MNPCLNHHAGRGASFAAVGRSRTTNQSLDGTSHAAAAASLRRGRPPWAGFRCTGQSSFDLHDEICNGRDWVFEAVHQLGKVFFEPFMPLHVIARPLDIQPLRQSMTVIVCSDTGIVALPRDGVPAERVYSLNVRELMLCSFQRGLHSREYLLNPRVESCGAATWLFLMDCLWCFSNHWKD